MTENITVSAAEAINASYADIPEARLPKLARAVAIGVSEVTYRKLCEAVRVSERDTVVVNAHRYEGLSRGRGWARKGRGENAQWGERVKGGYRVGPGRWEVGATDGFRRKDHTTWDVEHVTVGPETWTIAR